MVETFGVQYENGRTEVEFYGRCVGKKYRVKWTNLNYPYEFERLPPSSYLANCRLMMSHMQTIDG